MEIIAIFLLSLSLSAAQYRPGNPSFRNPDFRNVRTPLATSATRDRSYISIPIVLLPDGQAIPKPKHATYHYIGNSQQSASRPNNQRNNKPRGSLTGTPTVNSPVATPLPISSQRKKIVKPPKVTSSQLNIHLRSPQSSSLAKQRGQSHNFQQNQPQKSLIQTFQQAQQVNQIQNTNQQRNPVSQLQNSQQSQQASALYKQNLANFVNFATNLGSIVSQHQNQPLVLPTQTTTAGVVHQNQQNHKIQDNFSNQKSLLSNHKLNNGVVFQHQVPNLQTTQAHISQVLPSNLANHNNNGYSSVSHQLPQQSQTSSQSQKEQDQQPQSASSLNANQYSSTSNIRSNSQQIQDFSNQNNVHFPSNQANLYQQSSKNDQNNQNNVAFNNFNSQIQQNNHQSYAAITQQTTPAPQVVTNFNTQTLPKSLISIQQHQLSGNGQTSNLPSTQTSYNNQNQAIQQNYNLNSQNQNQQVVPSSGGQSSTQEDQTTTFSLQNTPTHGGQISDSLAYFQYQTAQDLPVNYASLFNQGQTGYISSSQNIQQNDPEISSLGQSYSVLPNSQSLYSGSSIPTLYVSSQQESSSSFSPSGTGIQSYDSYSNDQSSYPTILNQGSYITPQNLEKGYSFLQNTAESQPSKSSESQISQSSSSTGNGHLVYTASSPKQISLPQSQASYPQQYGSTSYQSSPTYVSFSAASSKPEAQTPETYSQKTAGVITPGTTYGKSTEESAKQSETSEAAEDSESSEYDDEEESEEEASYKVVYIPLDILKNILSNSVENQNQQ